jgi:ADP-ribose pyrophosphatase
MKVINTQTVFAGRVVEVREDIVEMDVPETVIKPGDLVETTQEIRSGANRVIPKGTIGKAVTPQDHGVVKVRLAHFADLGDFHIHRSQLLSLEPVRKMLKWEIAKTADAVAMILRDRESGGVFLNRNFRYPVYASHGGDKGVIYELPAGKMEPGETAIQTAIREAQEEVAFVADADSAKFIGAYYTSPGLMTEKVYIYELTGSANGEKKMDEMEAATGLKSELVSPSQLYRMLSNGTIQDLKTAFGLTVWLNRRESLAHPTFR